MSLKLGTLVDELISRTAAANSSGSGRKVVSIAPFHIVIAALSRASYRSFASSDLGRAEALI
jgi:hypothetical protein